MKLSDTIEAFADYPRLAESENKRLIVQAQAGAEKARRKLLKASGRLLKHLVLSLDPSEHLQEDLFQVGLIGVNEAIDRYRPDRGAKWSTYCYTAAKAKMLNELRRDTHRAVARYDNPDHFIDPTPTERPEDMFFGVCDKLYVREHIKLLPARETHVAESYWGIHGEPEMIKDISDRLGVTRQRTSEIKNQAIRHLHDSLTKIPDSPPAQLDPFASLDSLEYLEAG
jgi:RNA polymerase sigma factor (sigma-70 family)